MPQTNAVPYDLCPVYESERFSYRLVQMEDAQDLLECYSDPESAKIFNSDNCTSDFIYHTVDEMKDCIQFWLDDYRRKFYVRFSIVEKSSKKAVGTIECFARPETTPNFGRVALLRLDLPSRLENQSALTEILDLVENRFYDCFDVQSIMTKAVPEAGQRILALKTAGYHELKTNTIVLYGDYYLKLRTP